MDRTLWILEKNQDRRFPYRLFITKGQQVLLSLLVQDRWPGQKGNIFCLRDEQASPTPENIIEEVPVISIRRYGKRLAVVLDRPNRKRCDFLFLKKKYKTRDGYYEQIFWRTEVALKAHRPRVKLTTYYKERDLSILVDIGERYPWRLPGNSSRAKLPVGDYALVDETGIVAIIERKTFENMISEFGRMAVLHQQLSELEAYEYSALVIEANYSDFLNPNKLHHYSPAFAVRALAEIQALHPGLPVVFAGNRKLAQQWAIGFFNSIKSHKQDVPLVKVAEVVQNYGQVSPQKGGQFFELKQYLANNLPEEFTFSMLKESFPDISVNTIRRVLNRFRDEGLVVCTGRGPKALWKRIK